MELIEMIAIGVTRTSTEAERAIDDLISRGLAVKDLRVIGEDLVLVQGLGPERAAAALRDIGAGGFFGAMFGVAVGFAALTDPVVSGGVVGAWGAGLGAGLGALVHGVWRRRRGSGGRRTGGELRATSYRLTGSP
jgi:hypothetical protein